MSYLDDTSDPGNAISVHLANANTALFFALQWPGKTWHVVLAPPGRRDKRGLARDMLAAGNKATVIACPHRTRPDELRAERITIAGKTTEPRRA